MSKITFLLCWRLSVWLLAPNTLLRRMEEYCSTETSLVFSSQIFSGFCGSPACLLSIVIGGMNCLFDACL